MLKSRVVALDHHLGDNADYRVVHVALCQRIAKSLLDVIADISLTHSAADVEWHGRNDLLCGLAGQQDAADLRAVAVYDGQLVAAGADLGDVLTSLADHLQLGLGGGGTVSALQGISAQRDYDLGHDGSPARLSTGRARP